MSNHDSPANSEEEEERTVTTKAVTGKVNPIQQAIDRLKDKVPPGIYRSLGHVEEATRAVKDWGDNADPHDLDALAGAKTIIDTEQSRIEALREEVPSNKTDLIEDFDELRSRLDDLENLLNSIEFTTTVHVVYVNSQYVARYTTGDVTVETILSDAGKEDPDELGLFPLDGLTGDRQEDQAFPADKELTLGDEYRMFFESTSDGGKIAHE